MMLALTIKYMFPTASFAPGGDVDIMNGELVGWRRPELRPTAAEILAATPAAQAAFDAAEAEAAQAKLDRQELRSNFNAWRSTLQGVRDEVNWTNAKRDEALREMAIIQLKMLKILRDIALP